MNGLEHILNNTDNISHFDISSNFFIIHMKNYDTIEVTVKNGELSIEHYKYEGD